MAVVLHQFRFSHFNEKVRWALDFKGVAHGRIDYLPGPHVPAIRRLSGQTQTPVLELDGEIIAGSAAIIDRLEHRYPQPALYPRDERERRHALALQERFDRELGPAVRTVLFAQLLREGAYLCRLFAGGKPLLVRLLYRGLFPFARGLIARANGVDGGVNESRCEELVDRYLDEIAESAGGWLAADAFSVADLTAAALLAPIADPAHPDMRRPEPVPDCIAALREFYAPHPAIQWVNRCYAAHRQ